MFCPQLGLRESRETPGTSGSGTAPWGRSKAVGLWGLHGGGPSGLPLAPPPPPALFKSL